MTQFAQPFYDEYNLNWAPSSSGQLYEMIDGITADDDTYVSASLGNNLAEFQVLLSPVSPPVDNLHSLRCRLKLDDEQDIPVTVCLWAGDRIIAAFNVRPETGWNTWSLPLNVDQIKNLKKNYGNLRLSVIATGIETQCKDTTIIWPMVVAVDFDNCSEGIETHGTIYAQATGSSGGGYEGTGDITIDGQAATIKVELGFTPFSPGLYVTFLSGPDCCTSFPGCSPITGGILSCDPLVAYGTVSFDEDCCESGPACRCDVSITEPPPPDPDD